MSLDIKDPSYLLIKEQLESFCKRVDENIVKEQEQLKACQKKTELESKLAQELKLNAELTERLEEVSHRNCELDRVCATFESRLTIADSDRNRLDNAKDMYQIAKEITGIRFDFSAPSNVAKGYMKNESRKLLEVFDIDTREGDVSDALWKLLESTVAPGWPLLDKENMPPRNK